MTLYQYKNGFRYTSDTLLLFDFILRHGIKNDVLDIGAGCGILGLLVAKHTKSSVILLEKDIAMSELCKKNSTENNLNCGVLNNDFLQIDISNKFDFIISNPPFYNLDVQKSADSNLRRSRYCDSMPMERWLTKAYKMLKPKGQIYFCYSSDALQEICNIASKLSQCSIANIRFVHAKQNKPSKLVLINLKKDSKAKTVIMPPLIAMNDGVYSYEVSNIFKSTNCLSVDL